MRRLAPLIVLLAVVAACSGGGSSAAPAPTTRGTTTTTAPPPVLAPTTTAAPSPTTTALPLPPLPAVPSGDVRALLTSTGVVVPVEGAAAGGFSVETPCGNKAIANGQPLAAAMVVLDAGHGGNESGAIGPNGLREKDLNLNVVRNAKGALEADGVPVALTRTGDYRVTLGVRAEIVTKLRPLAFVSVHHNSSPDGPRPEGPGTETYFQIQSPQSKRLAGLIYEEVVRSLSQYKDVAWVADTDAGAKYRPNSRGGDYYGILRMTAGVPSALAELAFVTNPPEADLLARPDVQAAEGRAVARGIVRYLTTKDPGSGFVTPHARTEPAGPGGGSSGCTDPPLQ
jgi:N-acetylmuramoyl-L-alanine amidase